MTASPAEQAIAMTRFGYGGLRGAGVPEDPRSWLIGQVEGYEALPDALQGLDDTASGLAAFREYRKARQAARKSGSKTDDPEDRRALRRMVSRAVGARLELASSTRNPFAERLVHFWANHFAVSIEKGPIAPLAGPFETEAIRPHVMGDFRDLLLAVEQHPAMLLYLDQATSIGPNSPVGERITRRGRRQAGLNENLAREIMELHTLGVRSGYSQDDVTEFARALTGWTIEGAVRPSRDDSFVFRERAHEPGVRTVLGRRYPDNGEDQARSIILDLASSPTTSRHIATKLARHFVTDLPPESLIARLDIAFRKSGGHLPSVYRALVEAPEAWATERTKFLTPFDWLVAAQRATGVSLDREGQAVRLLSQLGQPLWRPGSPAGYPDVTDNWAAPDALFRRIELAQQLARRTSDAFDARAEAARLYPGILTDTTRGALARAESSGQATALMLASPEAMWR